MSRTIGHTGNRFGGAKRGIKDESCMKRRAKERELESRARRGVADPDSILWPLEDECCDKWGYY